MAVQECVPFEELTAALKKRLTLIGQKVASNTINFIVKFVIGTGALIDC